MERLDYRINEDGVERWISYDKVTTILEFLVPHIAEEIEQKMRWDGKPYEYRWQGKNCRIEYKGPPPPRCAGRRFADKLGVLILIAALGTGMGCKQSNKLLWGEESKHETVAQQALPFHIVACCRDNNAGVLTYPASVPAEHVQLCENIRVAERTNDSIINGEVYLAMDVDCGTFGNKIGDEYY